MGTKVHFKSFLPGYYSMRDLNEDSSSSSWPIIYGDNNMTNGQYYNGFIPRTNIDGYPGYSKDALKHKMLEHEAVFKNQVYELHRLYRIQRDMMEEAKRKEPHKFRASIEPSSSSSLRGSQVPSCFPLLNSTSISGVEIQNSPMSCTKGINQTRSCQFPFRNGGASLKESEPLDSSRPSKVRKRLFDLQLPADEYIDTDEGEKISETKVCSGSIGLADLNEPVVVEEATGQSKVDFFDHRDINGTVKSNAGYLGVNGRICDGSLVNSSVESRERRWLSHLYEAGSSKSNITSLTHGLQKEQMHMHPHPSSGPFFSSSSFAGSWAHPVSSWPKPTSSFTQKLTTMGSCLDSPAVINGFCHGSVSGLKETKVHIPSAGFDNIASDRSTNHGFGYFPKGNSRPVIDINLNEAQDGKSNPENRSSALPWLKHKPNEASDSLCCKSETVTDLNQPFTPKATLTSSDCEIISETRNIKKILGFPIFETGALENVPSSRVSTSASISCPKIVVKEKKNRLIDINLECEPDEEIAAEEHKHMIDLNAHISDCEDALAPSYEKKANSVKIVFNIDLESEAPVENEEDIIAPPEDDPTVEDASRLLLLQNQNEEPQDKVLRNAAETIFAISTSRPKIHSTDISLAESLIWFVNTISLCANELETNELTVADCPPREIDDFETMTLQLEETKEEDYMPTPFVPEFQIAEETCPTNNTLMTRSRRGQSRRGRQRRDFQRDILPGLASLSRHEVTEDIQTFGGLMRATGHNWVSGLTRRNGGPRGRKRAVTKNVQVCAPLVQHFNKIEGGLEDRSLTGWGKTTRRPRRQRCATGNSNNSPAIVLT